MYNDAENDVKTCKLWCDIQKKTKVVVAASDARTHIQKTQKMNAVCLNSNTSTFHLPRLWLFTAFSIVVGIFLIDFSSSFFLATTWLRPCTGHIGHSHVSQPTLSANMERTLKVKNSTSLRVVIGMCVFVVFISVLLSGRRPSSTCLSSTNLRRWTASSWNCVNFERLKLELSSNISITNALSIAFFPVPLFVKKKSNLTCWSDILESHAAIFNATV